jgi:uncharacterized membrane protein YfcA
VTVALVIAIIFVATLIRTSLGFGEALIAVPLLAFVLPVQTAAPLAVLVSITIAAVVLLLDWRHVHIGGATRLVLATLPGIPVGLWLLRSVQESIVKGLLGAIVAAFAVYGLRRHSATRDAIAPLGDDRLAWGFGAAAGVLGGAYGMNGPPLVIYGALRGWPPERFRATLQGYFLPASVFGMAGYAVAGLWTPAVTRNYLLTLPATALAIVAGRALNRRISGDRFLAFVYAGLIASGMGLIVQALLTP